MDLVAVFVLIGLGLWATFTCNPWEWVAAGALCCIWICSMAAVWCWVPPDKILMEQTDE